MGESYLTCQVCRLIAIKNGKPYCTRDGIDREIPAGQINLPRVAGRIACKFPIGKTIDHRRDKR